MQKLVSILLVDDDKTSNFLNQLLFKRLQLTDQVHVAENGAEGLQLLGALLESQPADTEGTVLVLLDVNMPVMNGFEFLEAYRRHFSPAQQQRVAVVMLTTSLHARDLERIQQLPIAGLVNKPLTAEKMAAIEQDTLTWPETEAPSAGNSGECVFQLLYRSYAVRPPSENELYELLNRARPSNATQRLTGLLLYRNGRYVQLLEGPEPAVRDLYAKIQQDPRHTQVVTVQEGFSPGRRFGGWSMAVGRVERPAAARLLEAVLAEDAAPGAALEDALWQDLSREVGAAPEMVYR